MYQASLAAVQYIVHAFLSFIEEPMIIPSALLGSFLAGICNKLTDLIDDEGLLAQYQGTWSLMLLQITIKTWFPAFFVLLFAFNMYAAGLFAATYSFAWILRGKVGNPSKQLETIICVMFLPGAFSLIGGSLVEVAPFFHSFFVAMGAHVLWLRVVRSRYPATKRYPYTLVTELGLFRSIPMIGLSVMTAMNAAAVHEPRTGGDLLTGILIVMFDNFGHALTKHIWTRFTLV